jgi:hypothetical protein
VKLSAKKKGEMYDIIFRCISDLRIELKQNGAYTTWMDCRVGNVESKIAQALFRLLDKDYK